MFYCKGRYTPAAGRLARDGSPTIPLVLVRSMGCAGVSAVETVLAQRMTLVWEENDFDTASVEQR